MLEWLTENYQTILILAVVAGIIVLDIVYLVRKKKKGGICGSCDGCCEKCAKHHE